ncbi:VWA domain-containing protein [Lujinxingia vulgaris]|uniref:VWA domain-containing protein n=1 Tax=Lujinxingia vulgaris TaxID=2600176 RepID=A0A5C6XD75_9DELT|nr:vWA domain-containing protein [Lujinxingia vulgaris]TXD36052.1 VWA domain-containing protein [Lujinxingia vulgaris]
MLTSAPRHDDFRSSRFAPRLTALLITLAALLCAPPLIAQESAPAHSAQSRSVQFLIVVDDSGSMRVRTAEGPAADPERLAIFATRSLLSMLDDRDEVSVLRLNGAREGESPMPIAPLAENRARLQSMLANDGPVAAYPGKLTPCASALDAVRDELNRARRPNTAQVVLFLTDGECNDAQINAERYLDSIDSHQDELFQFYLLRWRGRVFSEYLVDLARESGGSVGEVGADDPTDLLGPFANALSRSQGYSAHLLRPGTTTIPAHTGARRIRLLAVAPDQGSELRINLNSPAGQPSTLGASRSGLHQYEDGKRYRYVALDYEPGTAPVTVQVSGGANRWRVVALPDYRLFVETRVQQGRCGSQGEDTSYVQVGAGICVTLSLVNEKGQAVSADVASRGTEAALLYQEPGARPRRLPAAATDEAAIFRFERVNLQEGDHILSPRITLPSAQGTPVTLRGAARNLQVSTRRISATPANLEAGDLLPGTDHFQEILIDGNFPATRARLTVARPADLPECVTFALSGVATDQAQTITPGQSYTLETRVAPYCGPVDLRRTLDNALRLEFDRGAHSIPIPTLTIPVRAELISQFAAPTQIETTLRGGQLRDLRVSLSGNHRRAQRFDAVILPTDERTGWPGEDLRLTFLDAKGNALPEGDQGQVTTEVVHSPGTAPDAADSSALLTLRLRADACCEAGIYTTEIALVPRQGASAPVRLPLTVQVEAAGLWRCWGTTIARTFFILLLLLVLAYIFNMWRSSHFLDRDRLADRLVPLYWSDYGETRPQTRSAEDVRRMVRKSLGLWPRLKAWLAANPLVFGLPGRDYYESAELVLDATRNIHRSRLRLSHERELLTELRANPRRGLAKIYTTAQGGISFYAVPAEGNRLGVFELQREFDDFTDPTLEFEPKLINLRRRTELIAMHSDREPDTMAGWRIG